jgi:pilus assembly protein Flp/PilA
MTSAPVAVLWNWETRMMRKSNSTPTRMGAWRRFVADENATTAIEYGLMAALISLAIIGTVEAMGSSISTVLFGNIADALSTMSK